MHLNSKTIAVLISLTLVVLVFNCTKEEEAGNEAEQEQEDDPSGLEFPLPNSIVSTDIDFIRSDDPDSFLSLEYLGQDDKEMPDSQSSELFDTGTYVFSSEFSNGYSVEIWAHSSFGSQSAAQEYVDKLVPRLGKLPDFMLETLHHVVLHNGNAGAFAESEANFFVVYSENMDTRIDNNDLEETVFHESVHATLDAIHLQSDDWMQSQLDDGVFITDYAASFPNKEDLAETALFVYTMQRYPGRLASDIEDWISTNIPNRKEYITAIFE